MKLAFDGLKELFTLLRDIPNSNLVLHLLNEINISVAQTVDDFMIEEGLLHDILVRLVTLVPRLHAMQGILVHQLHAMQGLGPVVMITLPHHQNKGHALGILSIY